MTDLTPCRHIAGLRFGRGGEAWIGLESGHPRPLPLPRGESQSLRHGVSRGGAAKGQQEDDKTHYHKDPLPDFAATLDPKG